MNRVNLAYYEKEDYDYFLSIIDDRENLHDTWEEWYKAFMKLKRTLVSHGLIVKKVKIDLNELVAYCKENNVKNDGKARSQFVSLKK